MTVRLRRRLVAALSPAVLIDIALSLLPFWPSGLLPRDLLALIVGGRTIPMLLKSGP